MTLTRRRAAAVELASFCADLRWAGLPREARERTKELVLDLIGVALRGSAADSSRAVQAFVATQPRGEANVLGTGLVTGASWAALANGTGAHATELDDVTRESSLHPGVAVIPAALAVAQERASTTTAFLEAVVAGYETTMRVGNALGPASAYRRGFHPTGVAGVFGAAVAAGRLSGLDADGLTRAIGIAGTMASGSIEYVTDGAWTKRLNPGWAAHAGIVAAGLAAAGFTGPATALDGSHGLLTGYADEPLPELLTANLGRPLQVMKVTNQAVRLLPLHAPAHRRGPRAPRDARHLAGGCPADPSRRAVRRRASHRRADRAQAPAGERRRCAIQRTVRTHIEYALGEPENPVSRDALVERFVELAGARLDAAAARSLAGQLLGLDSLSELPRLS